MRNLQYLKCSLQSSQDDLCRLVEECNISIRQMLAGIETVEEQLRIKRLVIEDIQTRHEALLGELTEAVQDLGSVLSPDQGVPGGMVIAAEEPVEDPGELMLVFEEPAPGAGAWDEWVDHGSWTAAVLRSVDKS